MTICVHCDEFAAPALFNSDDLEKKNPFCCYGCQTVYNVLHQKGLETYYQIKKDSAIFKSRPPVEIKKSAFEYLDDTAFLEEFSYEGSESERVMEFYLEGIHCLACLWLIEKLPEFLEDVKSSKLSLERSVVTVVLNSGGKFSQVARELNNLGYRPHPLKNGQEFSLLKIKEERAFLMRIGVAGAAAGNIMIYAVSLYGGASEKFADLFNFLTVLFAVPVLTYCAYPLYRNAWLALKNRTTSIDVPISLALLVGGVMGIYNLVMGIPENYFDSLTTLVFFLLLSRYFLHKIQEKGLSTQDLNFFYQTESVLKRDGNDFRVIHPRFIEKGDVIKVLPGEFIPVDGTVIEGASSVNNSLLTGESVPVKVTVNDHVFSGTQNLNHELVVRVEKKHNEGRLGSILKNVEDGRFHRSQMVNLTNRVAKYFTFAVFILSGVLFFYLNSRGDTKHALEMAITLLIVTCPCALALATPLTFTRSLSLAGKEGIIIKSDETLEKISKVQNIFLDKTGTITYGKLLIYNFTQVSCPLIPMADIIHNLEKNSRHPVALALKEFIRGENAKEYTVTDFEERAGKGVQGEISGHLYEINSKGIFEDQKLVATFLVDDRVRADSKDVIKNFTHHGFRVEVLSGDQESNVNKIINDLAIDELHAKAQMSPEEKSDLVRRTPHSLMVGDGANDAIALAAADVGVAAQGAMDISLRAADVYLTSPGLSTLEKLITLSHETMRVIRRNFVLSISYNSVSVAAVFMGYINPLVAAIIMPLSSLTVLVSTLIGTKKMRQLWK